MIFQIHSNISNVGLQNFDINDINESIYLVWQSTILLFSV
jgi:hypothetical protein